MIDAFLFDLGDTLIHFRTSRDVGRRKPHPEVFRGALHEMDVPAGRSICVRDRIDKDTKGASRVGMKTVWLTARGSIPVARATPDHIIRRLSELPPILRSSEGYVQRSST